MFDEDGRSGEISQIFFSDDDGSWIYEVTGLGTKADFQISGEVPPGLQLEPEAVGDPDVIGDGTEVDSGIMLEAEETLIDPPGGSMGYRVPPSGLSRSDVEAIVRSWVNLHRIEVNNALRALESDTEAIDNLTSDVSSLRDSISELVAQQVQIENTRQSDYEALAEVDESSLGGFIRNVGGFLLSPFDKIKDALEQYILGEVRDGLNR